MTARVLVEQVKAKDLQPGDLFTIMSQDYWDLAMDLKGVGESVYVRTNRSANDADDADSSVFKVTIQQVGGE